MRRHSTIRAAVLAAAAMALLGGCGRRGALDPPLDPSVEAHTSSGDTAAPIIRRPKREPIKPPQGGFILDPLL